MAEGHCTKQGKKCSQGAGEWVGIGSGTGTRTGLGLKGSIHWGPIGQTGLPLYE